MKWLAIIHVSVFHLYRKVYDTTTTSSPEKKAQSLLKMEYELL